MIFSNLNEDEFELDREYVKDGVIYKEVRIKNRGTRCLNCGTFTTNVKEYRTRIFTHSLYNNRPCKAIYHQRRFICPNCGKTKMEDDPFRSDNNKISDKTVIDILKDRDKSTLSSYFRKIDFLEKRNVKYIGVDMNDNYRDIARIYFPNALSFHVVKNVSKALDDVRIRILRRYSDDKRKDEYYMLKYRKDLLFETATIKREFQKIKRNHHFHYDINDSGILEMMLSIDKQLNAAYQLYHAYIRFNNTDYDDLNKCINDLNELIVDYKTSSLKGIEYLMDQ